MRARRRIFLGTGKRNCTEKARAPWSLNVTIILVIFSILASYIAFGVLTGLSGMEEASAQLIPGTQYIGPMNKDFLSLAIGLMPQLQANQLNISNVDGSFKCDLRVPLTYVSSACMSSVSLLVPFTLSNNSQPTLNQSATVSENLTGSPMAVSIGVVSDNVTLGGDQTVSVTVSNESSSMPIEGAIVHANVTDAAGTEVFQKSGVTDSSGQTSYTFTIPTDASAGTFQVDVNATAAGFEPASESTSFEVLSSELGTFDNGTSDTSSSDGSSSSSGGSSSSSNSDLTSPTVKSTTPSDNDNNVALNTDVKVTFSESIDKNTIDTGSLTVFNLDRAVDPDVQSVSVSGKSATFNLRGPSGSSQALEPSTRYEATISSSIEDQNGNFLDCAGSKGVDSNCQWQFSTASGTPTITINPTSGPVLTTVDIDGAGFDPVTSVTIAFGGKDLGTILTDSAGTFSGIFRVPIDSTIGDQTVKASQGSNSASQTFKVTAAVNPIIALDPTSGPVSTPVDIAGAGFDSDKTVFVTFNGTTVITTPTQVKTDSHGLFLANFTVPPSSPTGATGDVQVVASEGSKSANETFSVTSPTLAVTTTSRSNAAAFIGPSNQSNALSTTRSVSNLSNASVPAAINGLFATNSSNGTSSPEKSLPSSNASSSEAHETTLKKSVVKIANTTSLIGNNNKISDKSSRSSSPHTENKTTISASLSQNGSISSTTVASIWTHGEKTVDKNMINNPIPMKSVPKRVPVREVAPNNAPFVNNDIAITKENMPINLKVLANDRDGNKDKLSIVGISPPQHGTVITNKNGTLTYIPEKLWAGVDTLSYSVTDGQGGIATGNVLINVKQKGENHVPTAKSQSVSLMENGHIRIALQAKDPDGDPLRFIIVNQPSHGQIAQFSSQAGTLFYSPEQGYSGHDSFKFKVNDGTSDSNSGKVIIKVQAINDKNALKNQLLKQTPLQQQRHHESTPQNNNNNDNSTQKAQEQSSKPEHTDKTTSSDNNAPPNDQGQVKEQSKSTTSNDNSQSNSQEQTKDQTAPQQQEEPKTSSTDSSNNQPPEQPS